MKMTQAQSIGAILALLNNMNLALTDSMTRLAHDHTYDNDSAVLNKLNLVMNGITSLTSIYSEAQKRMIIDSSTPESTAAGVSDSSDPPTPKNAAVAALLNEGKDRIVNSIKKTMEGVNSLQETGSNDLNVMVEKCVSDKLVPPKDAVQGRLAELVGSDGLLFRYLSDEVDPRGKGEIRPSLRFPIFVEDVLEVSVSELSDYPEGFYHTVDNKSKQLLLRFSGIEYLWLFTLEESELYVRSLGGEWKNIKSTPMGSVKMIFQMLEVHLQTYDLKS